MNAVIVGNFGVDAENAIPDLSSSEKWYDYYTQEEYNKDTELDLSPGEYKILTSEKIDLPDVPEQDSVILSELFIYPSPVIDFITIDKLETYNLIQISDMQGNIVFELIPESNEMIDLNFLRPGIYIVKSEKAGVTDVYKIAKL